MRHIWRAHRIDIGCHSNVILPDDDDLPSDDPAPRSDSGQPAVSGTSLQDVAEPRSAQTEEEVAALRRDAEAECRRQSSCDAAATESFSNVDEDRPYQFRLVPSSAGTASSASSQLLGTGGFPPVNPVSSEQQATCVQLCHNWDRPWTSAGSGQRGEGHCSWPDSSSRENTPSTLSGWSLPSLQDGLKSAGSGIDTAVYSGPSTNTTGALFQKRSVSTHVENRPDSSGATAERFACPLCSLSYKRVADLNRHMKQKHWTTLSTFGSSTWRASSESTLQAASHDRSPLSLTDLSQPAAARRKHAPQEHPLDLSINCKTSNADKSGDGKSSNWPCDRVGDRRNPTSRILSPSVIDGSTPSTSNASCSSQKATLGQHGNAAVSLLSASAVPSFCASFAKFMENVYRPLWKSYLDGMLARKATAERAASVSCAEDCRPVFGEDLIQMNASHRKLSRGLSTTDDNNNTLNCDPTGRSAAASSRHGADVSQSSLLTAVEDTATGDGGTGGSWGQCPLCPFVCPHPLVMRRHLDIHDESELPRTCAQTAVNVVTAAEDSCKTSLERGVADRQGRVFSSSYQDVAVGRSSTSHRSAWSSTLAARPVASSAARLTASTPSWLPALSFRVPDPTPGVAGNYAGWNSASGSTTKSAGPPQAVPGKAGMPFPPGLGNDAAGRMEEEAWRASDWRQLYECWKSRLNATDAKNRVDETHPAGEPVVKVTASAADTWTSSLTTNLQVATATVPWRAQLPPTPGWWTGWTPNGHLLNGTFPGCRSAAAGSAAAADVPTTRTPLSSHMRAADFKVTYFLHSSSIASGDRF